MDERIAADMENTVLDRLNKLETQNRKLRAMAFGSAVAVFVFLAIGIAPKKAITQEAIQESVLAKSISVVDAKGKPRIVLGIDEETGPVITVLNKKGNPAVSVGVVDKDGSSAIKLSDKNEKGGVTVFGSGDGTSGLIVDDKTGVTCITIGVDPESTPVVQLNSSDEKATANVSVADSTPRIALEDSAGNAKVVEPGK